MNWDGTITMTDSRGGQGGFVSVAAEEILYFQVVSNAIKAHTRDREYYAGDMTLDRLSAAVCAVSPNFYRTDRLFLVNLAQVAFLDKEWSIAYFDHRPHKKSKYCCIARMKLNDVDKQLNTLY